MQISRHVNVVQRVNHTMPQSLSAGDRSRFVQHPIRAPRDVAKQNRLWLLKRYCHVAAICRPDQREIMVIERLVESQYMT